MDKVDGLLLLAISILILVLTYYNRVDIERLEIVHSQCIDHAPPGSE